MSKELMIERIEKAQKEIEAKREKIQQGKFRQNYHFMAETGWINDPNGLIYFKGKYHFFYQYNPYSGFWDYMHWGHAVSEDMIHWEYLPLALAPSEVYDDHLKGGCFSGSAIEHDGKLFLIYTGTCNNGKGFEQSQCIAYSEDGIHFEKYEGNPVITAPEGVPTDLFRDPKVWKHDDTYYVVCGASQNGFAQARLYKSTDMFHWEFVNVLAESRGEWGYMWECPDFFALDGCQVLIVSPQFMRAEGLEFHNGNNSIYFTGDYEKETMTYTRGDARQVDYGMDFYAPQTVETTDGRRVMIAWLQSWDNFMTPEDMDWTGLMTIPRELHVKDGSLVQLPVREIENYYTGERSYENVTLENQSAELDGITGRSFDMTVEVKKEDLEGFSILLACDDENYTELYYNRYQELFTVDRTYSGLVRDVICSRSMKVANEKETIKFRIVMDKYTIEVFANDGKQAMTTLIYTDLKSQGIVFSSDGKATFSVTQHTITMPE